MQTVKTLYERKMFAVKGKRFFFLTAICVKLMSVFTFHWTSSAFLALLALIEHHYFFYTYYNDTLEDNVEYFSSFLLLH